MPFIVVIKIVEHVIRGVNDVKFDHHPMTCEIVICDSIRKRLYQRMNTRLLDDHSRRF
jgi:hypothetical protein